MKEYLKSSNSIWGLISLDLHLHFLEELHQFYLIIINTRIKIHIPTGISIFANRYFTFGKILKIPSLYNKLSFRLVDFESSIITWICFFQKIDLTKVVGHLVLTRWEVFNHYPLQGSGRIWRNTSSSLVSCIDSFDKRKWHLCLFRRKWNPLLNTNLSKRGWTFDASRLD